MRNIPLAGWDQTMSGADFKEWAGQIAEGIDEGMITVSVSMSTYPGTGADYNIVMRRTIKSRSKSNEVASEDRSTDQ